MFVLLYSCASFNGLSFWQWISAPFFTRNITLRVFPKYTALQRSSSSSIRLPFTLPIYEYIGFSPFLKSSAQNATVADAKITNFFILFSLSLLDEIPFWNYFWIYFIKDIYHIIKCTGIPPFYL